MNLPVLISLSLDILSKPIKVVVVVVVVVVVEPIKLPLKFGQKQKIKKIIYIP